MHLYGKKHLKILFSKSEDALWVNLCIYYWEHLHVCSGCVTQVSKPWPVGLLFVVVVVDPIGTISLIWVDKFSSNCGDTLLGQPLDLIRFW